MSWGSSAVSTFGARNKVATLFVLCAAIIGVSHNSYGYGKVGHQAVAAIAEQNLTKSVHAKITDILGDMSMADAAVWPDQIKHTKGWAHTSGYHFADTEQGQSYLETVGASSTKKAGDVIRALVKAEDVLRDDDSSNTQKRYAISFMIHLVGDLHQPLHEGYPEDKGGNDITLTYFNLKTNLHAVWDTEIINNVLSDAKSMAKVFGFESFVPMTLNKRKPTEQDVSDFVDQIRTPSDSEVEAWQNSYLIEWSQDSTEMRDQIYSDWKTGRSASYQKKYAPYLEEKILRGGYRLAAWLNAVMAGKPFQTDAAQELRQTLAQKIGKDYDDTISLEPQSSSNLSVLTSVEENPNDPCAHDDDDDEPLWAPNALGL